MAPNIIELIVAIEQRIMAARAEIASLEVARSILAMPMTALSIRQPWAWAICAGHKDVENRSWKTAHRGPFAVHAGSARPAAANIEWIRETFGISVPPSLTRGALIGVANLVDIIDNSQSPWAEHGQLHWILADAELWATPIPCRGQLRLFHPPQLGDLD